jgi:hypothetical protein
LTERRARIAAGPQVPEEAFLDAQLLAAQRQWRKLTKK